MAFQTPTSHPLTTLIVVTHARLKAVTPMAFFNFVSPKSLVWIQSAFSGDLDTLVLGFGANIVTVVLILLLAITRRDARVRTRISTQTKFKETVFLYFLPALGACLSCLDLIFLLKKNLNGEITIYLEWLFKFSQLATWTVIILSSLLRIHCLFLNRIFCFGWLLKLITGVLRFSFLPHQTEALVCFIESFLVLLDILFGIYINMTRIQPASLDTRSLEDPFLHAGTGNEEDRDKDISWWDSLTFGCITSVMKHGVSKQLDFEDLLWLPTNMDPSSCHEKLLSSWQFLERKNPTNHPSLLRAICYAYGWPYFRLGFLKVFNDCIGFTGPLLLNKLIQFLEKARFTILNIEKPMSSAQRALNYQMEFFGSGNLGYVLALSLGLTSILKSFLDTQYSFYLARLKLNLRSSIMTLIYRKCLSTSIAARSEFSQGEVQTFMSVDADRIVNLCNSFHDIWSLPLQIGVALYLLYTQVKFAFLSGLTLTVLLIPVNKWISTLIASATEKMMKQKDERIRRTGELLMHIRSLKMYAWELLFADWLKETRSLEVKHLATRKYLDAWCVFFWATTPTLFSLSTFGLFTLMGHQLDAATVFTCLALFNSLISPLNSFPWVINGLIDAFISTRRLSKFLCCLEHKLDSFKDPDVGHMAIVMHDVCCDWSSSREKKHNLTLDHITLCLPRGLFVAVIGEVGSGKSSLLNGVLGEMRHVHGSICLNRSVAYVPQVPWILSGTIRDNILFGKTYESKRYDDTLKACALDIDLSSMVGHDMAHIGEKGVNLSGGQRSRLALARAIYHASDLYLFDDVLSAVDAQVGKWILHNAILGPLMKKKTRVLCTHNIQAISAADMIVVMERGQVKWVGSSTELSSSIYSAFSSQNEFDVPLAAEGQESSIATSTKTKKILPLEKDDVTVTVELQETIEVELRKEGRVEPTVYKNYAAFSGWFITIVIALSAILMQASRNGNDLWLSYWVDTTGSSREDYPTSFYLVVLSVFCLINSAMTLVRAFSFAYGGLQAAVHMHDTMLSKIINAPIHFFDQTPCGRILNRFSSDLYTIDDSLPFILNILLANFVGLLGIAIVLSYVQVVFLLLLLPFWYIYSKLQFFYRSTSRELRRLDSVSRSPIYASFTETLDGSSTIRAFKCEDYFLVRFTEHLVLYQRTSYSELIASLWLSLRLQLLGSFIVSFVAVIAVVGSQSNLPISLGTPGLVGLALSYAAPIVSSLGSFLTSFTETEKEMVAVERALQYMDVPQEELHGRQTLNPNWPFLGLVEFQNVTIRYMPSLPPALKDVTFTIGGGTQVGIVGRTGAGKSSVLNALFCLTPICRGEILVDGINVTDIPVKELRASFAIVPQSPFLFDGSLRDNLDPFRLSDDINIWNILGKCHVKEEVEEAGGLDIHLKESGASFSVGQRQLLCLARALLKSSKVLCLDECTASVDTKTASVLQNTIATECKGMTVITIAHRISTVLSMDNILILDHGNLVEQGNPHVLLQDEYSIFSSFAKASKV